MITQADVENYGSELVDFSRRAALETLGPEVRQLQQQNAYLQAQLRQETRRGLEQQLDQRVPGWGRTYDDPAWREWLDAPDDYSGRSRRELINRAAEAGDATRVAAFFQHPSAGHHTPAVRQSRASATGNKPVYTREQIKQLYAQRARGAISDANWARQEADIIAAGREGRVRGAFDLDGNQITR
jgi:hypothetical protein